MNAERQAQIQRYLWVLLFLTSLFLAFVQRDYFQLGTYKDDASYVLLAKSIISSDQYGSVSGIDDALVPDFPFGFPLLLSPFLFFMQDNLGALKLISLVATLVNVAILYWGWVWLMPGTSSWWGLAVSGLYAVFPLMIRHTSMVMSEPIFTTVCLAAIIVAEYSVRQEKPNMIHNIALGVLLALCILIRTVGIALLLAILLYFMWKKRKNVLRPFASMFLGMSLFSGIIILITPLEASNFIPERYIRNDIVQISSDRVNNLLNREESSEPVVEEVEISNAEYDNAPSPWEFVVGGFIWHLETDVRDIVLPVGGGEFEQNIANRIGLPDLPRILGLVVSAIIFFGMIMSFVRIGPNVYLLFAAVYYGLLVFWVWEGQRLIYPIQPQFQFAFLFGLFILLSAIFALFKNWQLSSSLPKILLTAFVSMTILLSIIKSYTIENSKNNLGDVRERTQWVVENTESDAVILSTEPTLDYLYTQRNIVGFPYHIQSDKEFADYLESTYANYLFLAPELKWQTVFDPSYSEQLTVILPYINQLASENIITLVHEDESTLVRVYQVNSTADLK